MLRPLLTPQFIVGIVLAVGTANVLASRAVARPGKDTLVRRSLPAPVTAAERAESAREQRLMKGGQFYKPLRRVADFPGISQPELHQIDEVNLAGEAPIVGVEVDGIAYAFLLDSMEDPTRHVINTVINNKSISVTYCNFVNCVRVLSDESDTPVALNVGGLDVDNQMVLLFNGERYGQSSSELPLVDYKFSRMSLDDWKLQHPQTRICLAPAIE